MNENTRKIPLSYNLEQRIEAIEERLLRIEFPSCDDAERIVQEVEDTLRQAVHARAGLDETSFLRGAMAAFLAVYGEKDGRLPLAPPRWFIATTRGDSILDRKYRRRTEAREVNS